MAKRPRIDGDKVRERLANMDRGVFLEPVARALEAMPTATRLKELASDSPEAWSRYTRNMASLAGFGERHEHAHVHITPDSIAPTLLARFGRDRAKVLMKTAGLPLEALDALPDPVDTPSGEA